MSTIRFIYLQYTGRERVGKGVPVLVHVLVKVSPFWCIGIGAGRGLAILKKEGVGDVNLYYYNANDRLQPS